LIGGMEMVSDFWNELFRMGDDVKAEYGADSSEYAVIRELDRRLQKVYDKKNALTVEVLKAPPENVAEEIVHSIRGLKVTNDGSDLRFEIAPYVHCDTLAEVLQYIVDDRNRRYDALFRLFDDAMLRSVEEAAHNLFNKASADFHEALDESKPKVRKKFDSLIKGESE